MHQNRAFQHNGQQYEIRVTSDGNTINVRAFCNGKPANGYTYSVEVLTQIDAKMSGAVIDPAEELVKTAISDVKSGIWDQYVAAISATRNPGA